MYIQLSQSRPFVRSMQYINVENIAEIAEIPQNDWTRKSCAWLIENKNEQIYSLDSDICKSLYPISSK